LKTLADDGELSAGARLHDSWGTPFVIACNGEDVTVRSAGPDRHFGTADDIRAPEDPAR
jgi:hypothetical protein